MKKLKIGIIGVGGIGHVHMDSYRKNPNCELYALCDIDENRLHAAAKEYGVERVYTDVKEMVKLEELDAVSVCTWNSAHAPCTIAALNAGKHVLCEKPMTTCVADALAMQQAARESGKLLMIGFVRRFGKDMEMLRDFAANGYFGDFYYARANYLRRYGNPGGWFGDKSRSGGGPLIDLGVHVIDFVRYAMGNPRAVSVYGATYQKLFDRPGIKDEKGYVSASATDHDICDVEDLAVAMIRFDNGATLSVQTSFSLNIEKPEGDISLFGDKAGIRVDDAGIRLCSTLNGYMNDVTFPGKTDLGFGNAFVKETTHFIDCIREGIPCRNPAEDGVELMRILGAVYESAKTGHEVILSR